jgi:hypothetical protein
MSSRYPSTDHRLQTPPRDSVRQLEDLPLPQRWLLAPVLLVLLDVVCQLA